MRRFPATHRSFPAGIVEKDPHQSVGPNPGGTGRRHSGESGNHRATKFLRALIPALVAFALILTGGNTALAQNRALPPAPVNFVAMEDPSNPGVVMMQWDEVPSAGFYRVGWMSITDYEVAQAQGRGWEDAFVFADVANLGQTSYIVTRLEPGVLHAFVVGSANTRYGEADYSAWATLTTQAGPPTGSGGAVQPPIGAGVGAIPVSPSATAGNCRVGLRIGPGEGCSLPNPESSGPAPFVFNIINGGIFHGAAGIYWDGGAITLIPTDEQAVTHGVTQSVAGKDATTQYRFQAERRPGWIWEITQVNEPFERALCPRSIT